MITCIEGRPKRFAVLLRNLTSETLRLGELRVFLRLSPRAASPLRPEAMSPRGTYDRRRKGVTWSMAALELLPGGSRTFVVRAEAAGGGGAPAPARVTVSAIASRDRTRCGIESLVRVQDAVGAGRIRPVEIVSRLEIVQTERLRGGAPSSSR